MLFQFRFDNSREFTQCIFDVAIWQTALRHVRTSTAFAADARDEIARFSVHA